MKFFIASDHAGFEAKEKIVGLLQNLGDEVEDLGPNTQDSVHYPNFASILVCKMLEIPNARGILICGTGLGMSMVANKYQGIRAALCHNQQTTKMARHHNDANVLCLGARTTDAQTLETIVKIFRETAFEGGRHAERIALFKDLGSPI